MVEADSGQIQQVLLNLYVNAWQAMPSSGGALYLQTENVWLDEIDVVPYQINPGKFVKIMITDNGSGIDNEIIQKIFDPFFTTKEAGTGTGLGLATAYGIINSHGGFINVYSVKDEGTTFNIFLPVTKKETTEVMPSLHDIVKGTGLILLIDDEDIILEIGQQILTMLGYSVLTAKSGKESFEIYRSSKDEIAMVILDMIMPDISGGEIYDELKKINPKIKVLLSSGYSIRGQATEILDRGCKGFIQKPFNVVELSQKIIEILDNQPEIS